MAVNLSPLAGAGSQFFTDAGTPLTGGLLYTYLAGTTTPAATYSDISGVTANSNPIVLNAAGRVAGEVWLLAGTSYKFVLKTATLTTIGTWDNIDGVNDVIASTAFYADTFTCTAGQTTFTLSANPGSINNLTVSLDGAVLVAATDFTWSGTTVVLTMAAYVNQVLRVAYSTAAGVKAISPGSVVDASVASGTKLYNRIYDTVSVKDFGAIGDGVANDTAAVQAWLTYCGANNKVARGYGLCKITSALTYSGDAGIDWDFVGYDSTTVNGGLLVSGTGYTALTISGKPAKLNFAVVGSGNTANGVLLQNIALLKEANIRVYNLDGFGLKINKCYDCTFNHISVQNCGNTSQYAFSMNDDGDTCNMTHIGHLQVEFSNAQSIYISPNSLCLVVDSIHSERLTPNASYTAWVLGGGSSQYNSVRLNSSGTSANAKALLNGIDATYVAFRTEGNIPVTADCSGGAMAIVGADILGTYAEVTSQTGRINFVGGRVAAIAGGGQVTNTRYVGTLLAGVVPNNAVSFTPTWVSSGTAVALGNGTVTGIYWLSGTDNKMCNVRIRWASGSTTTYGTGSYTFALPFTSANNGVQSQGTVWINNSGVAIEGATARVQPNSAVVDMYAPSATPPQMAAVGATSPHTFKNGDQIDITVQYLLP